MAFELCKLFVDMSINSRYTHAAGGREMAATSSQPHGPAGEGEGEGDCSSYYSSSEEELGMAGPEEDTRRLLRPDDDGPRYGAPLVVASPAALYPGHGDHQGLTHPAAGPVMAAGNAGGEMHNTQYGSVSSSLPSNGRNKTKWKRYRLPFLILLVFDCGLVIFLSIISYDSKVCGCMGVFVCVCERERKREREKEIDSVCVCVLTCTTLMPRVVSMECV